MNKKIYVMLIVAAITVVGIIGAQRKDITSLYRDSLQIKFKISRELLDFNVRGCIRPIFRI